MLRSNSRSIDTAARQGGDEFALVLPETTVEGAQEVMNRVCDRVAKDSKHPTIALSAGFAVSPQDGCILETLMAAADHALYKMKEQHKGRPLFTSHAAE